LEEFYKGGEKEEEKMTRILRHVSSLRKWSKNALTHHSHRFKDLHSYQQLKAGQLSDWSSSAKDTHTEEVLGLVHLWMNSSDFPLQKKVLWGF
jgi:hypothetical protein